MMSTFFIKHTKYIKTSSFLLFIIFLYLLLVLNSISKPLMWDETYFARMGLGLSQGSNFVYFDESVPKIFPWYPSIYFSLMTIFHFMLGGNQIPFRMIGVVFFILSIPVLYLFANKLFSTNKKNYLIAAIVLILYIISPFAIQGSTLVEIDTSILNLTFILFNLVILMVYEEHKLKYPSLFIGLSLGFLFYSKFTIPVLILIPLIILIISKEGIRKGLFTFIKIISISSITFFMNWYLYSSITNISLIYPFVFVHNRTNMLNIFTLDQIKTIVIGAARKILWLSPQYFLLFFISTVLFIKRVINKRKIDVISFYWLEVVIILIFYCILGIDAAGYPKYLFPIYGISLLLIINEIILTQKQKLLITWKHILFAVIILIYQYLLVGDPILATIQYKYMRYINSDSKELLLNLLLIIFLWVIPLVLFLFYSIIKKLKIFIVLVGMVFFLIVSDTSIVLKQMGSDYSLLYMYGMKTVSLKNTVNYLRPRILPTRVQLLPAEVAFYLGKNYKYYDIDLLFQSNDFVKLAIEDKPDVIVIRDHNLGDYKNVSKLNSDIFQSFLKINSYTTKNLDGYIIYSRLYN